jgi:acetyl esterase/lipase
MLAALVPWVSAQRLLPEELFKRWDKNKDGKLVLAELPQNAKRNFKRADANGDGAITLAEHLQFLKRPPKAPAGPAGMKVLLDLPYAGTKNPRQMLDLLLPEKRADKKPLPVLAYIHGGGWRNGSKNGAFSRIGSFIQSGRMAGVSIGYRLSGEAQWPAQIHDCKAAIRWIRANAKKYNLDPDRIAVIGPSAGGHLVAMLGTTGGVKELEGKFGPHLDQSSSVKCVIDFFGPTALLQMDDQPGRIKHNARFSPESRLIGAPIQTAKTKTRQASPLTHVTKGDAPHLIIHGTRDMTVPFHQSVIFHAALKKAGVESTLITVNDGGHGAPRAATDQRVQLFLERHFFGKGKQLPDETVPAR